jgi:hypothetical protein
MSGTSCTSLRATSKTGITVLSYVLTKTIQDWKMSKSKYFYASSKIMPLNKALHPAQSFSFSTTFWFSGSFAQCRPPITISNYRWSVGLSLRKLLNALVSRGISIYSLIVQVKRPLCRKRFRLWLQQQVSCLSEWIAAVTGPYKRPFYCGYHSTLQLGRVEWWRGIEDRNVCTFF